MLFGLINCKMKPLKSKILTLPLRISLIILIYGALFKLMHWPNANVLMLIGSTLVLVLYIIRFFYKIEKKLLDYVKLFLVLIWLFNYTITVFHFLKLPYVLEIILAILFFWWLIVEGLTIFKERKFKDNKVLKAIYYLLFGTCSMFILFGLLFKIQHWPYGSLLFTLGILVLSIVLIYDYFIVKRV